MYVCKFLKRKTKSVIQFLKIVHDTFDFDTTKTMCLKTMFEMGYGSNIPEIVLSCIATLLLDIQVVHYSQKTDFLRCSNKLVRTF